MIIILAIALALFATGVSIYVSGKDDAPIEEFAEDVLKAETGLDLDLTPSTPEH